MASVNVQSAPVERIIISLPRDLIEKLSQLAERKGLSRAAYVRMVLTEQAAKEEAGHDGAG